MTTIEREVEESDIQEIIAFPERFGFSWKYEPISAVKDKQGNWLNGGKKLVLRGNAPRPYVEPDDVPLFRACFGNEIIAKAINGTSIDVAAEDVLRRELLNQWQTQRAKNVTNDDLKEAIVRSVLFGQRARGSGGSRKVWIVDGVAYVDEASAMEASKAKPETFADMRGNQHPSKLEADQANIAILVDSGMDGDLARKAVLGMAS